MNVGLVIAPNFWLPLADSSRFLLTLALIVVKVMKRFIKRPPAFVGGVSCVVGRISLDGNG